MREILPNILYEARMKSTENKTLQTNIPYYGYTILCHISKNNPAIYTKVIYHDQLRFIPQICCFNIEKLANPPY
jgi:hypothetical protein